MPAWKEIYKELKAASAKAQSESVGAVHILRKRHLKQLEEYTDRNVIGYYSGFLSKPGIQGTEINDEDLNGFMNAVHGLDRRRGLDLLLHTPGGSVAATVSIVTYLRQMFRNNIRAIVPQLAMSGGTMMACSSREIVMGKHSKLGPTDPQLGGVAAAAVIDEFERACEECKKDPSRIAMWSCIIGKYPPTFLSQCDHSVKWANEFMIEQLMDVMLTGIRSITKRREKATEIAKKLSDYAANRRHERPLHIGDCRRIGLKVTSLEADQEFQDRVLTVHHCYMHALMNGPVFKIIENHGAATMMKHLSTASAGVPGGRGS